MNKNNKAAGCWDTQAAQINNFQNNFSRPALTLKALYFRVATWVNLVGGVYL
jgi:hypothetical protein